MLELINNETFWLWADRISIALFYIIPIILYIKRKQVFSALRRAVVANQFFDVKTDLKNVESAWDGLVLLPSNPDVPDKLIKLIKPKYLGIISTPYCKDNVQAILDQMNNNSVRIEVINMEDSGKPYEFKHITKLVINELVSLGASSIAVDITGGKSLSSIGMFMAAEELQRTSIYLDSNWENGKPSKHSSKLIRVSTPKKT